MSHDHHHHHHHDMSSNRIGWAFFLNLGFTIIEFIGGVLTNSTAILADAVHDLGDSLSIGLAWLLNKFSKRDPSQTFTYGYQRLSLVGAFINAVILIAGSIWVLYTAIPRLLDPVMPVVEGMIGLAVFGVAVNGYAAFKLSAGETLNERVLNWHLIEDVLGWVAVLIVSIVLYFVNWPILDPLLSIGFTLFILLNVIRTLASTVKLFVQASPSEEAYIAIQEKLIKLDDVKDAHHIHFWSLDGERHVLTAHIVVARELTAAQRVQLKLRISEALQGFNLAHTTIELEYPDEPCRDH
ncbi:cobalt-zinc-cadmium efflux system protein [Idiomarina fontislapidosi]|uniref:Cation transporter n=1 Tax=Idiomarina fontislapidosi TaxID=263723 RepID=A0A432XP45_9GAMM|nr:cation diffusion facilitator family transporter [Idiomarina fontislapidosi]PYE30604.1 cobalt-zinc-cadmium efflux system protein [Idiomarina fontislapidosi]RUO50496.1 cation transporter [Idiomarina fontislapidosi]